MAISAERMKDSYFAKIVALTSQGSDPAAAIAQSEAIILSLFEAICEEIVANSELVPVTSDSGEAGAGIITGKVK
jgi:hypothetical protein